MSVVVEQLKNEFGEDMNPQMLTLESDLRNDLGLDSFASVTLIMDIEEKYGISISEEELSSIQTIGDVVRLIEVKLKEKEG